jgi:hypothetical protein
MAAENDDQLHVWLAQSQKVLPEKFWKILADPDGVAQFVEGLPQEFSPSEVATDSPQQKAWGWVGAFYRAQRRFREAIPIYAALYDHMLAAQELERRWCHKGMPLVWITDCYRELGYALISLRYLMLTLVEDAIRDGGSIKPQTSGAHFRAVGIAGVSRADVDRYAREFHDLSKSSGNSFFYPEWVLHKVDQDWVVPPLAQEVGTFPANPRFLKHLMKELGDGSGKSLEFLAGYLLSCMPGCRTMSRKRSGTHEYDLVCSVEGSELDFRSELGRYFVCECKDTADPEGVRTMAILCRVLDSVKSRFGILFSTSSISGAGKGKDAELEQLKIFQDRGTVIVVVDKADLEQLAEGANFVSLLRRKYERVRLNLSGA